MRSFDGIKHKNIEPKEKPRDMASVFVPEESFSLPDESSLESIQPNIANPEENSIQKTSNIISSIGLKQIKSVAPRKEKVRRVSTRTPLSFAQKKKIVIKTIIAAVILIFLFIILVQAFRAKREITTLTYDAKAHLSLAMEAINDGEMPKALSEANIASKNINRIKLLTQSWGQDAKYLQFISPNSKLVASEQLLGATYLIAETLTSVNQQITTVGSASKAENIEGRGSDFIFNIAESQTSIISMISTGKEKLLASREKLVSAEKQLDSATKLQIDDAKVSIDKAIKSLQFIETLTSEDLPWLSGADGTDKNILILLQNNGELRGGSGGSLGSFGVARFSKGTLKTIDFGKNIYKIDQAFEATGKKIEVPTELKYLRGDKTWTLKDSGWAVDGNEAAKKIMWFYEQETGEKVDGTIMIDASAVISLLAEVGPIEMTAYGKTIDAKNFRAEIESEVHDTYFNDPKNVVENEPKKILGDMMPIFMNKVFAGLNDKAMAVKLFSSISKSLKQKDITFYFTKSDFQSRIDQMNYSGAVNPSVGDYLYVNNSNIDGAKSSLSMRQNINLGVTIHDDGALTNDITLTRKHTGVNVLPDGINKNFVRLLLPEKSTISRFMPEAGNFERFFNQGNLQDKYYLGTEAGKTSVNFWMSTDPGQESEVGISYIPNYKLSMDETFEYIINFQKQPGANADKVNYTLNYPEGYTPTNVKNVDEASRAIQLNLTLDRDRAVKIKFRRVGS